MVPGAKRSSPGKNAEPLSSADDINGQMKPLRRKQPEEPAYLLADAMRHVREAVLITTADLDPPGPEIVYVNEGFCRMTGYAREEVIGKTPRFLQGPKTDRSELDRLRRQLSLGEPFDGEIVNYTPAELLPETWDLGPDPGTADADSAGHVQGPGPE